MAGDAFRRACCLKKTAGVGPVSNAGRNLESPQVSCECYLLRRAEGGVGQCECAFDEVDGGWFEDYGDGATGAFGERSGAGGALEGEVFADTERLGREGDGCVADIGDGDVLRLAGCVNGLCTEGDGAGRDSEQFAVGSGTAEGDQLLAAMDVAGDGEGSGECAGGWGCERDADGAGDFGRKGNCAAIRHDNEVR